MDMENTQNNMPGYSSGESKKTVLITIVAGVVVLVALIWWMKQGQVPEQVQINPTPDPEAATINQDVDNISVEDLNAEFQAIDNDLQGL